MQEYGLKQQKRAKRCLPTEQAMMNDVCSKNQTRIKYEINKINCCGSNTILSNEKKNL